MCWAVAARVAKTISRVLNVERGIWDRDRAPSHPRRSAGNLCNAVQVVRDKLVLDFRVSDLACNLSQKIPERRRLRQFKVRQRRPLSLDTTQDAASTMSATRTK